MLLAEGDDELLVGLLLAVLVEDAHVRLATVQGLGGFAEATGEAVVDEGKLQDSLEGVDGGQLALRGVAGDLDDIGDLGGVIFDVRL